MADALAPSGRGAGARPALAGAELIRSLLADPAERAGRLSDARREGRGPLRRQGQVAAQARRGLHQAAGALGPAAAHGRPDPVDGVRDDGQRGRGAAARGQPDQALPADVQHRPARRQELPLHLPAPRPRVSADRQASRRQARGDRVFRAVRLGGCGQRHAERAAQGVPVAQLPRQHLQHAHPALPAISRSSAARRRASAGSARTSTAGSSTRCASSCPAGRTRSRLGCRARCRTPARSSTSSALPSCATG